MRLIDADKLIEKATRQLNPSGFGETKLYSEIIKLIATAPTVNEWIPVSERLPEDGDLFVTLETGSGDRWSYEIYDFANTNYHPSNLQIKNTLENYGVIAWKPIEPYEVNNEH